MAITQSRIIFTMGIMSSNAHHPENPALSAIGGKPIEGL